MNIHKLLSESIYQALISIGVTINRQEVQVHQVAKTQFGDYQVNGLIAIAKKLGMPPRQLARKVLKLLKLDYIAQHIDIAGPGFINIFLDPHWLAARIDEALDTKKLNITPVVPQIIVVDYSAPNVAKEMHVGHVRSTIIGDAVVRTLEFLGHKVIRANHIGDWGTQFGMLIAYLDKIQNTNIADMELSSLEDFYRAAKHAFDTEPDFAVLARNYVVKLQGGDDHCLKMWRKLVEVTIAQNQLTYDRLNVTLTYNDIMGESLYNDILSGIVTDLKTKGLAIESDGAIVVFLDEFKNSNDKKMGVVIQKKDGAYLYTTTDIACAKYRYEILHADRMIYYIDSRQHQHLAQAWAIVRKAGYVPESVPLEHHMVGMMLGKDGKPFKTRTGGTVKLTKLLDEAIERAYHLIANKNPNMDTAELQMLSQVVGIGAIKYADLSKNRTTNYVFDWNKMLSFEGNTAPYIQYAYTRIASIFKYSSYDQQNLTSKVYLDAEQETKLAVCLLQFEEVLTVVASNGTPNVLCSYLYNLAVLFSLFYEHCPIFTAKNIVIQQSRLKLCLLTSRTIKQGLNLLGIQTVERM